MVDNRKTDDIEVEWVRDHRTSQNMWVSGRTNICGGKEETKDED